MHKLIDNYNRDLKNRVIDNRAKDSHSVEIDGDSKFCGHRFLLKTKVYGDKKCIYCAKWFHWCSDDALMWMREKNIDSMNKDGALEPLHCNSDHCREYHNLYLKSAELRRLRDAENRERRSWELFKNLKKQGRI